MNCSLTLNYIKENWCSATVPMDRVSFLREILPDSYNPDLCAGQGAHFLDEDSPMSLAGPTIMGLMRGNRKSTKDLSFASVAFTKDFQQKLAHNSPIRYREPDRTEERCVENMLKKLRLMIRRYCAPQDRNHMLFTHMDLTTLGTGPEGPEFERLHLALEMLMERGTERSLTYALFLMVVASILQSRLGTVQHLYSAETITRVLEEDEEAPVMEVDNREHVPFTDPKYMHSYNIYAYHDTQEQTMYQGTLIMQMENNRPTASMTLTTQATTPVSGDFDIHRVFTGVPMLSKREQMVYIAMSDERNTFVFLMFPYAHFNFTPMFYRSGILVRAKSQKKEPVAQKVAITAKKLTDEELPYIWGLLRADGNKVMLTEQQYQIFRDKFRNYHWMSDFETHYASLFEAHKKSVYYFHEDELLAWSIGELPYEDRLRILLALRSVDNPSNKMQDKFLESNPPSRTHALLK